MERGRLLLILGALALVAGAAGLWWLATTNEPVQREAGGASEDTDQEFADIPPEKVIDKARDFYESRPHFQRPMPYSEVPEGLPNLRAETCGACHQAIYEEWKISTHRRAWTQDPQFMAELAKSSGAHSEAENPEDVGWMCVNCHTPMVNQLEKLVVGLEGDNIGRPIYAENPHFDPKMQDDAITCATCHVRDGVVYGPYGDTDAPHPTAKDPKLREPDVCTQCHQAEAHWPSRNLACFFSTGEEFRRSPYAEEGKTCQSCHMPTVERKLAANFDGPKRKTRRHWFGGSLIPKMPEHAEALKPLREVYGDGAAIEVLRADEAPELRLAEEGKLEPSTCPEEADEGCQRVIVRVINAHAGHNLPTGDPERHLDISAEVVGADDEVLARAEQRIASKYKWWPDIELQYDNRIAPREHLDFALNVPADLSSFRVRVTGYKYRMYEEAYEHHDLEGRYVRGRPFHESTWQVRPGEAPTRLQE